MFLQNIMKNKLTHAALSGLYGPDTVNELDDLYRFKFCLSFTQRMCVCVDVQLIEIKIILDIKRYGMFGLFTKIVMY